MVQVVRETTAEYSYFINQILTLVTQEMGKEYHARILKVIKNNSLELDSLVLLKEGKNFAPNIYLQPYYEAYRQGAGIRELVERICAIYRNCVTSMVDEGFRYSFEEMKRHIIYRLVSYERNQQLLEKIPHTRYLDLAITYHCLVRDDEDGIGTIRITNEHLGHWNTQLDEIHTLAAKNTKELLPSCIKSMEDVIKGLLLQEGDFEEKGYSEAVPDAISDASYHCMRHSMYILTNDKGINGAACLLYDKVLSEFCDRIQSDFFIFPSSVHEVILVPASDQSRWKEYGEMVREINETQVAPEEVLSNHVYYYSKKKGIMQLE